MMKEFFQKTILPRLTANCRTSTAYDQTLFCLMKYRGTQDEFIIKKSSKDCTESTCRLHLLSYKSC